MKIKQYINKIVAIAAVVALVSGFQVSNAEGTMATLESTIGIEEAYAGACSDNGCIGGNDKCMDVEILWGAFRRTCWTTVEPRLIELES